MNHSLACCVWCGVPGDTRMGSQGSGVLCLYCLKARARERARMKEARVQRVGRLLATAKDPHASMRKRLSESPPGSPGP